MCLLSNAAAESHQGPRVTDRKQMPSEVFGDNSRDAEGWECAESGRGINSAGARAGQKDPGAGSLFTACE